MGIDDRSKTSSSSRDFPFLLPLAATALLIGLFVRFWQLGGAPLAVDEYYFGTSILNIVEHGLPRFACGGYYTRGLLIQYLALPLVQMGASIEFAVRFWPAVASLLTIAAVWRIARIAGGLPLAALAVILTSLSVWEIEFARFGRMYAPFQAAFLWYLYFQIRHLLKGDEIARWWSLLVSAVSIVVYAGASFLLVLNFLPLVWQGRKTSVAHTVVSAALFVTGVKFYSTDFRYFGLSSDALPPSGGSDVEAAVSLPVNLPPLPEVLWPIAVCGLLGVSFAVWTFRGRLLIRHPAAIFWALAVLCLGFGLFGCAAGLLVAGLLLGLPRGEAAGGGGGSNLHAKAILLLFLVWSTLFLGSYLTGGSELIEAVRSSLKYLIDYPDVYYLVLRPWLNVIPATTFALAVLLLPALWTVARSGRPDAGDPISALRYLLGVLVLLVMLAAIFRQPYAISRYTYFLYPALLIPAAAGILRLAETAPRGLFRSAIPFAALIGLFMLSEDFSARHLANINEPQYRFRTAYDERLAAHYYPRWDFRSAAEFVNDRLAADDRVIVFDQPLPHYLERTDGAFVREKTPIHTLVWACNGTRHLWSNAPLLDRESEVRELIARTRGRVWLITRTEKSGSIDSLEQSLVRQYALEPRFTSQDGHLAVYAIDRAR